jgi:Kef-type K+ transport system membrane component KefB
METFTAASHHDILVLMFQLAILLFTARMLGELAQWLGQPTVVGEIFAGILLGPSLLSGLIPALGEWIVPQTEVQGFLLENVSLLGVMFLLIVTGLEINIPLIRSQARSAVGVAIGGLLLPLAIGFSLGQMLPDHLLANPAQRFVFALFLATSMSISAIPVVAKVLLDLNLTRRDIGQTIIAAAMIDDTTGWILLSVVIGLAGGTAVTVGSVLQSVGSVLAFLIISFTAGQWLVSRLFDFVQNRLEMRDKVLSLIILCMFMWGTITQFIGLEALLGAFVTGVVFGQVRGLSADVIHKLESIALGIFAPIFFAVAGLKVNALNLLTPELMLTTIVVIGVAVVCKIAGVYAGSRIIGKSDHWTALFFGAGLNARGSMEIIVATIGLTLCVLTQDMFSIIVVMAVFTSVMAPALLRWALSHIEPSQQELNRLEQEKLTSESMIANVHRVLLPVRLRDKSGTSQLIEGTILEKLQAKTDISLTLITVVDVPNQARAKAFLDDLETMFSIPTIVKKVLVQSNVREQILEEARKGYDLMILGAAEKQSKGSTLFTPLVDDLIRLAPCPTIMVQGERLQEDWTPE